MHPCARSLAESLSIWNGKCTEDYIRERCQNQVYLHNCCQGLKVQIQQPAKITGRFVIREDREWTVVTLVMDWFGWVVASPELRLQKKFQKAKYPPKMTCYTLLQAGEHYTYTMVDDSPWFIGGVSCFHHFVSIEQKHHSQSFTLHLPGSFRGRCASIGGAIVFAMAWRSKTIASAFGSLVLLVTWQWIQGLKWTCNQQFVGYPL